MLTKELVVTEVENSIRDFCKVLDFSFECLEESEFFLYKDGTEFKFVITVVDEDDKFLLNTQTLLKETDNKSDEITIRTIESDKEIQKFISDLNLYLYVEEDLLILSYTSGLPDESALIKAHTVMHLTSLKYLTIQIGFMIKEKINTENKIRTN